MQDLSDKILFWLIIIMTFIFFLIPHLTIAQEFINDDNFSNKTSKGIVVVEFWAEWNSKNQVPFLENLRDCKSYKLCIVKNSKMKSRYNIMSIPTLVVLNNGVEEQRFLPNIMFELGAEKKQLQKAIDKIMLSKFQ